jgi:ribosomal 50S subunit-recycling heat shock protein
MEKRSVIITRLWALALVAMAAHSWAQESGKPTVTKLFRQVEATVQAVDPATRQMTLLGPRGTVSVNVDQNFKNLEKVHVGDKVKVSYYEGIATRIVKDGSTVTEPATSRFQMPSSGEQPGHGFGRSMTAAVKIEGINHDTHTVAFRGSDGRLDVVGVESPEMRKFVDTLKPGDTVEVTYTESVAVNIVPARGTHVAEGK